MTKIVQISENATLLGGASVSDAMIAIALRLAPILFAADGGAQRALSFGRLPAAVIGDFDSLSDAARAEIPAERLYPIAEQDSTDFEKTLRVVHAPLYIGVGFSGARLDHELAALNVLVRYPGRKVVLLGESDVTFLCPPVLDVPLRQGARVSLFPMVPVTGRSEGLVWPISGIDFAPGGRVGTSNAAEGAIRLEMDGPGMLVMLPVDCLEVVVAALAGAPGW